MKKQGNGSRKKEKPTTRRCTIKVAAMSNGLHRDLLGSSRAPLQLSTRRPFTHPRPPPGVGLPVQHSLLPPQDELVCRPGGPVVVEKALAHKVKRHMGQR